VKVLDDRITKYKKNGKEIKSSKRISERNSNRNEKKIKEIYQ
jgi:hypothetical protein